jgi:hypothetical protein
MGSIIEILFKMMSINSKLFMLEKTQIKNIIVHKILTKERVNGPSFSLVNPSANQV